MLKSNITKMEYDAEETENEKIMKSNIVKYNEECKKEEYS